MTKIQQSTAIWPVIMIVRGRPHKFYRTGPPHLVIRPWVSNTF